ncbi:hypothetical protein [Streptomyces chartreusis]|uniref:UL36 very large tegument protein n=2 Tax=Streptomyces chartreusis TaxID=1969 RepID=A0A2N9B3V1_STRCX|nr:hypothetical protein [Streptomyces chartreusis]SOR78014.1 hypothetical protein SCNRRL3882_1483 [Streptomyces chartreusis NRRL 3882]
MAADRLPSDVREFVLYLDGLLARLDPSGGWCAVFWQRDPEGMRACLDGREMPPWDVVEALLQDLAGQYGPGGAGPETERARSLHAAALAAYDARPGGRDALGDRLDVMLREQKYAAERQAELTRLLATAPTREQADALRLDLAWAHDDHERATARCAELRARMADLDRRERGVFHGVWDDGDGQGDGGPGSAAGAASDGRGGASPVGADAAWSGAWRRRPDGRGFVAADRGSRAGSGRGASPGTAPEDGRPAGAHGHTADGPSPNSGRGRPAPGGPYDPGTPATPWHRDDPASGVTGVAGRDAPRHTDAGTDPTGRPGTHDGEFPAGRAASREARADAREREGRAGWGASGEAGGGGASGVSGAPVRGADGGDGEFHAGRASSRQASADGASGVFGAPAGWADARDAEFPAGRAASREARADAREREGRAGWGASREAAASGAPGAFAATAPVVPEPLATPASSVTPETLDAPEPPAVTEVPAPKQRKRRRGGARFAGMVEEDAAPVVAPSGAVPLLPDPAPATGRRTPRGARFAGAAEDVGEERAESRAVGAGGAERRDVARAVETLARLRKEGRSGEAHALLAEAASWAPVRFPLLAHELERAGLGADWQTLLWEAASLPAGRLVAAADALGAAGRAGDGQQILRQGVARPPGEIGEAVLGLVAAGRDREVRVLLDAYVRARTPEEAARSAEPGPQTLVPLLLEAARGVSDERRWDLVHALRVAGFPA